MYKANGRELNRYPWLQQEKIPSAEPDHREKENDLRTGAASTIASTWLDFNSRRRNAARGARVPGQNAEVRRWNASPKRWTTPNRPGPATAWPAHARETSSITERPARVACKKLRLFDLRASSQRIIPKTRLKITRNNHI